MTIRSCIDVFKLYVSSYASSETIVYYSDNLQFFKTYLSKQGISLDSDINILTKFTYMGYIAYHKQRGVKNTSVRTYARAIKVFLRYCFNEGYLLENITLNAKFPKSDKKLFVPLSYKRVVALDNFIYSSRTCLRNMPMFHLMLDCGLRRSEVVNLDIVDLNFKDYYVTIRDSKNSKSRVVPLPTSLADMLINYIGERIVGPVFLDDLCKGRITKHAISNIFYRLKRIDPDIHPHLLRHTFGTSFILGGGSLEVLRVLMGHEDYNITKEYLHLASQSQIINLHIYRLDDVFSGIYNYNRG